MVINQLWLIIAAQADGFYPQIGLLEIHVSGRSGVRLFLPGNHVKKIKSLVSQEKKQQTTGRQKTNT